VKAPRERSPPLLTPPPPRVLVTLLVKAPEKRSPPLLTLPPLLFLQVAGLVASVVTTPMDVVKTRVMTQDLTQGAVKIGVRQTVRSILQHEGPLAFTYGMLPRVMLKVRVFTLVL
jgi:hypothetical protein